jgi:hypothetical protein
MPIQVVADADSSSVCMCVCVCVSIVLSILITIYNIIIYNTSYLFNIYYSSPYL